MCIMKQFFLAFSLLFSVLSFGQSFEMSSLIKETKQQGKIKGIVLDNEFNNEPLAFASITVKDTNASTTTELDGSFSFNLKPGNYTLVFNFTGYKTIEVPNIHVSANNVVSCNQILGALTLEPNLIVTQLR